MSVDMKIIKNILWRFFERTGTQLVSFVVTVLLARLLLPEMFGALAMVATLITVLLVPIENGLGYALIQKQDADELDFSAAFYCNIGIGLVLFLLMLPAAPLIAGFLHRPELTPLIRAMSLTLVISGAKSVQAAYAARHFLFKRFFFASLGGTLIAGALGILLALRGFGVWALAAQYLVDAAVDTVILWFTVGWKPTRIFRPGRLRGMFAYSWKLIAAALMDTAYEGLRQLLIGLRFSAADLGRFNKAQQFPQAIFSNINSSVESVLFSAMSREQTHPENVRAYVRSAICTNTFILAPIMAGIAAVAEPLVRLLLTEKWILCVPLLRICCAAYMLAPVVKANQSAINALGRSDLFLKLELIKKAGSVAILLAAIPFGIRAVAWGLVLTTLLCQIVNAGPNGKLLNYPYGQQLRDIAPTLALGCAMGGIVFCVQLLGLSDWLTLLLQIPLGAAIYVAGAKLLRLESYSYLLGVIRNFKKGA